MSGHSKNGLSAHSPPTANAGRRPHGSDDRAEDGRYGTERHGPDPIALRRMWEWMAWELDHLEDQLSSVQGLAGRVAQSGLFDSDELQALQSLDLVTQTLKDLSRLAELAAHQKTDALSIGEIETATALQSLRQRLMSHDKPSAQGNRENNGNLTLF